MVRDLHVEHTPHQPPQPSAPNNTCLKTLERASDTPTHTTSNMQDATIVLIDITNQSKSEYPSRQGFCGFNLVNCMSVQIFAS
jgi:hypothetical protein